MLLPRLQPPLRAAIPSIGRTGFSGNPQGCLYEAFAGLRICTDLVKPTGSVVFVRLASHQAQGAVNSARDGPGKRLGAKKSGDQYVIPGNIIFRQRGTHWYPGENCAMGRDHTIYATESGYVKYYKDPEKHPKRQFIGVVFERDMLLPLPRNAMRRRRLGMLATKMELDTSTIEPETAQEQDEVDVMAKPVKKVKERRGEEGRVLTLRPGYMYREANWQIGRAAERAGVTVREFKPNDRWTAWRKKTIRRERVAEKKRMGKKKVVPRKAKVKRNL